MFQIDHLASRGMRFNMVREQITALLRRYHFEENSRDVFGRDKRGGRRERGLQLAVASLLIACWAFNL